MHHKFYHIGLKGHSRYLHYGLSNLKSLFLFADAQIGPLALDTTENIAILHDDY